MYFWDKKDTLKKIQINIKYHNAYAENDTLTPASNQNNLVTSKNSKNFRKFLPVDKKL